jgi:oxygen-independent coproporphyrinogen-3 oxidase
MAALHRQLRYDLDRLGARTGSIETVFIGGGTPSTVDPHLYAPIFETLRPYLVDDAEITAEANPNSATHAWLSGMYDLGVTRISFGVQSFDADKLTFLGRAHSPEQARRAVMTAAAIGYAHLSLDLIYNVAGDTPDRLAQEIDAALALPIDHLSAYELTIEEGTPFAATPDARQTDDALAFFVAETITRRGFTHYEISNFGTYQSRHNLGYWQLRDYIGAGAGAVGFVAAAQGGARRYYPPTDIDAYIRNPLDYRHETIGADELLTERIFLGLRSRVGIVRSLLPEAVRDRADVLVEAGKLTATPTRYHNPDFFLADEIALFLMG